MIPWHEEWNDARMSAGIYIYGKSDNNMLAIRYELNCFDGVPHDLYTSKIKTARSREIQ